jgi:organic radical activating enzyme
MLNKSVKLTTSLCPECYDIIPAVVFKADGMVWMTKDCEVHGGFKGLVERDASWVEICDSLNHKNIYNGYFIDATGKCNIKCKYCYHGDSKEVPKENIISDAKKNHMLAPFLLVGGEPTLNKDLPEIYHELSKIGMTVIVTNGIKFCDENYLNEFKELSKDGVLSVGISFHKEADGKDFEFVELCREKGLRILSSLFVIDEIPQIDDAIKISREYSDVLCDMRIKAASNLWAEKKASNKIYVSDMLNYLRHRENVYLDLNWCNKISYGNITIDGFRYKLVSWYDVDNIDINDINCPPYYKCKDGNLYNIVTSLLINEGLEKKK